MRKQRKEAIAQVLHDAFIALNPNEYGKLTLDQWNDLRNRIAVAKEWLLNDN